MTNLVALMSAGFLGLASGSSGGGEPIPISVGGGRPASGEFMLPIAPEVSPGVTIPIHKPSDFPFVIIVQDDGTDKAGGWQEAKANLELKNSSSQSPTLRGTAASPLACPFDIRLLVPFRLVLRPA